MSRRSPFKKKELTVIRFSPCWILRDSEKKVLCDKTLDAPYVFINQGLAEAFMQENDFSGCFPEEVSWDEIIRRCRSDKWHFEKIVLIDEEGDLAMIA